MKDIYALFGYAWGDVVAVLAIVAVWGLVLWFVSRDRTQK